MFGYDAKLSQFNTSGKACKIYITHEAVPAITDVPVSTIPFILFTLKLFFPT